MVSNNSKKGCYMVVGHEVELTDALLDELSRNVQKVSESEVIVLLTSSTQEMFSKTKRKNLPEYFLNLYRKHLLHRNERITVLSKEDQLVALQLVLAERCKQNLGEFDVEASTVLAMNKHITDHKLAGLQESTSTEQLEVFSQYQEYLSHSNHSDFLDVYLAVANELEHNESLQKEFSDHNFLLVINSDMSESNSEEKLMLELLCKGAQLYDVKITSSLGSLEDEAPNITTLETTLPSILERANNGENSSRRNFKTPKKSASESHVHSAIISYLELLVNSRSEMALARVINTPDRELDHTAFTELKRYARSKNMPMYQTALSFITRIRLGGKGYAPDPTCALARHVKGIGEFSDLMQKIQTIVEEDLDTRSACRRVVNILKNVFLRNKENRLRKSSIENAAEQIQAWVTDIISSVDNNNIVTPDKPAGCGGTLVGRQTVKVIRMLLDKDATAPQTGHTVNIFGDFFSSQKTPVHFPCLLTKFRSPEEVVDDDLNQSLQDRLKAKINKDNRPKNKPVSYKSGMEWAVPLHGTPSRDDGICNDNKVIVLPSKTLVQPGENTIVGLSAASRVLESLKDQENLNQPNKKTIKQVKPATKRAAVDTETSADVLVEDSSSQQLAKKRKLPTEKAKKTVRRKLIPQIKGQQSLTKFFRL